MFARAEVLNRRSRLPARSDGQCGRKSSILWEVQGLMWWVCSNNGAICSRPLMSEAQINFQFRFGSFVLIVHNGTHALTVVKQKRKQKKFLLNLLYEHTASKVLSFYLNPALFNDSTTLLSPVRCISSIEPHQQSPQELQAFQEAHQPHWTFTFHSTALCLYGNAWLARKRLIFAQGE